MDKRVLVLFRKIGGKMHYKYSTALWIETMVIDDWIYVRAESRGASRITGEKGVLEVAKFHIITMGEQYFNLKRGEIFNNQIDIAWHLITG
jgi:hypothetical protein